MGIKRGRGAPLLALALIVGACGGGGGDDTAETGDGAPATDVDDTAESTPAENSSAADGATAKGVYPQQFATTGLFSSEGAGDIAAYGEAPMLAEKVAAGELPPVEERLPTEPAVIAATGGIGEYGGELAGPATSPTCCGWDELEMRIQPLAIVGTDLQSIIPNIAESIEPSDDFTTWTVSIREGHKWSDGEPFTSEDFRFFFEDVVSNADLRPGGPETPWAMDGVPAEFAVIDERTVSYTYAEPNPRFIFSVTSERGNRGYLPAHYFKQFHLDYSEDLDARISDAGVASWTDLFGQRESPYKFTWDLGSEIDPGAPTLDTYVFSGEDSQGNKNYERNPFFFKVDTAGNQLPYVDTLKRILVEDLQVQDLKAIAGEFSHMGWGSLLSVPTYRDNEDSGNYRVAFANYDRGNEYAFAFNFTYPDEKLQEIYADIRFRQAMSLAIDRDEINELVYLGLATPSQAAPTPTSAFYEDWMPGYFADYDVDQANALLDEMGLDGRDGEGFRTFADGSRLQIDFESAIPEAAWEDIAELVTTYWSEVGVRVNLKVIDGGLMLELRESNENQMGAWALDTTDIGEMSNDALNLSPFWGNRSSGRPWQEWLDSDGAEGEEPPADIKELYELVQTWLDTPAFTPEWETAGQALNTHVFENLYMIGTIQSPPQPLLFKKNLCNTPETDDEAAWSWDYRQWVQFKPETWYFSSEDTCP